MSIWFLIWLTLSAALLFFSFWTVVILIKQKKAWESFAKRHELRFTRGTFLESPSISGVYKSYSISLFTGEHRQEDARKNRKLTAIEIELNSVMPMYGAAASGGMIPLLESLAHNAELKPEHKEWKSEYAIRTDNIAMMADYMSDERIAALTTLMKVHNAWVVFIFLESSTLLRLDMPNPLEDQKKMDILLDKMIDVATILELKKGESKRLEALRKKGDEIGSGTIILEESEEESGLALELESDEDITVAESEAEGDLEAKQEEEPQPKSPQSKSKEKTSKPASKS